MSSTATADDNDGTQRIERDTFLNREAAEVYLLLDFLSGRADRSLRPTPEERGRALLDRQDRLPALGDDDDKEKAEIEDDLSDPTRLVLRTMRIKYPVDSTDRKFQADAAFLVRARDVLNTRAWPATGATIAFTSLVYANCRRGGGGRRPTADFAASAYPYFSSSARALARNVVFMLRLLLVVLFVALSVSAYAAWGKVMLDTLDAVRRDDGATQQELAAARTQFAAAAQPVAHTSVGVAFCDQFGAPSVCERAHDITVRYAVATSQLERWELPHLLYADTPSPSPDSSEQKQAEEWATAAMAVLSNYIMPILYGLLGSIAFVLRRHYDRLAANLLSPRDMRANSIRLALGVLIGGCIGLIYSGSSAAQTTGLLGAAATLSTAAIAFLAGYGVEAVFKALDSLITQVFRVNGTDKAPQPAA